MHAKKMSDRPIGDLSGAGSAPGQSDLQVLVKRIRRKFLEIDAAFDSVQTVYGMGYRWVE